jgi:hypothetical protein
MKLSEYCPEIGKVLAPVMGEGTGLNCITLCHIHLIAALGAKQSQFYGKAWDFYQCVEELHFLMSLMNTVPLLGWNMGQKKRL